MKLRRIPIKNAVLEEKLEKFTYGLLYPAFFGNMIYDLIQAGTKDRQLRGLEIWVGLTIVLFNAVDYIHLYTDVDTLAKAKGGKDWIYIICDIATSLLFFGSFVALKYHNIQLSVGFFCFIPLAIGLYKRIYFVNEMDRSISKWFSIILCLLTLAGLVCFFQQPVSLLWLFFGLSIIETLLYIYYVFGFIPKTIKSISPPAT